MIRPSSLMLAALSCGGCSYAPNVPLFGAFFPAWMLCALIGIVVALMVRTLSVVTGVARRVAIPAAIYPLLALLFGAAGWIFFFRG
ncbi:MAG TPA: YtcA family lipoprotein [Steroidobacteraceae bacterium]|nr:YtcA family lipoprotein [Steroidobacteraceae bacterium]